VSHRISSKKVRALVQATEKSVEQLGAEFSAKPLSYEQIAQLWTEAVASVFPELGIRFLKDDVYRLFKAAGVRTVTLGECPSDEVSAEAEALAR
jgi:hypothetical protein